MYRTFCLLLVRLARTLESTRLLWEHLWFEVIDADHRFLWRYQRAGSTGFRISVFTPPGVLIHRATSWMHLLAVRLVMIANRGLPTLDESEGYLKRLYDPPLWPLRHR